MAMLENNPVLRERVLGVTAVSAILIGGAMGFDAMITSGWQLGGANNPHPAYAAMTPQQYFDDVSRDWTASPPQRVQLASADRGVEDSAQAESLEGSSESGALLPAAPAQEATPQAQADLALQTQQQASDQRFAAIESDIQQATNAIAPAPAEKTPDEDNNWPPS